MQPNKSPYRLRLMSVLLGWQPRSQTTKHGPPYENFVNRMFNPGVRGQVINKSLCVAGFGRKRYASFFDCLQVRSVMKLKEASFEVGKTNKALRKQKLTKFSAPTTSCDEADRKKG
jgi:hypothetical protein